MKQLLTVLAAMCLCTAALAQRDRQAGTPGRPQAGTPGPWDNDVLVYRVGADGAVNRLVTFPRAGVPTMARLKDGRLIAAHQHFPADSDANFDKVAIHFSNDEGASWTPAQVIHLAGLPDGMRFPFDPTLVPLPDGRVRLYFTSLRGQRFDQDLPAIYSATSTNGIDYAVEPGRRFGIDGRAVIDCAVVLHAGVYHLFSPDNGSGVGGGERAGQAGDRSQEGVGYHATSRDGLTFTRSDDVLIDGRRRWLGNAQSDGSVITFFGTGDPGGPLPQGGQRPSGPPSPGQPRGGSVWRATSRDGQTWRILATPPIPGADPGAVASRDGAWIVAVTGPPRR